MNEFIQSEAALMAIVSESLDSNDPNLPMLAAYKQWITNILLGLKDYLLDHYPSCIEGRETAEQNYLHSKYRDIVGAEERFPYPSNLFQMENVSFNTRPLEETQTSASNRDVFFLLLFLIMT